MLLISGNISFADDGYDNAAPNLIYDTDSNEDDILMEPGSRKSISKGQKNNVPGNLNWDDLENNNEIYGRPATASLDDVNLDDFGDNNNDISGRPAITPNDKNVMERLDDETDMENFEYDTIPEGTPQGYLYGK